MTRKKLKTLTLRVSLLITSLLITLLGLEFVVRDTNDFCPDPAQVKHQNRYSDPGPLSSCHSVSSAPIIYQPKRVWAERNLVMSSQQ